MRTARSLDRLNLAVGAVGLAAIGLTLAIAIRAIDFTDVSLDTIASACRHVVPTHLGLGDVLVLALGSTAIAVAVLAVRALVRQTRAQQRALRGMRMLAPAIDSASGAMIIRDARPQAFCAGYLRPRVYVSTEQPGLVGIEPERVDHLLGRRPRWELPVSLVTGAIVAVASLLVIVAGAARTTGPGDLSLPLLTAQACMIAMTVAPMLLGASLLLATKRIVEARR